MKPGAMYRTNSARFSVGMLSPVLPLGFLGPRFLRRWSLWLGSLSRRCCVRLWPLVCIGLGSIGLSRSLFVSTGLLLVTHLYLPPLPRPTSTGCRRQLFRTYQRGWIALSTQPIGPYHLLAPLGLHQEAAQRPRLHSLRWPDPTTSTSRKATFVGRPPLS